MKKIITWEDFSNSELEKKYLPESGEGKSLASQAVTAVSKLVYKWFNDGDVYDNRFALPGWANDLSSYANWIEKYIPNTSHILRKITEITNEEEYVSEILYPLYTYIFDENFLPYFENQPKESSIYDYDYDGFYRWEEECWEDDEDDYDFI